MIHTQSFKGLQYQFEIYNAESSAKPMIFLGGAFQGIKGARTMNRHLSRHGPVIALDLPGFGDADLLDESYSFNYYHELFESFVYQRALDEVGLIGASYGSGIGYLLAQNNPIITSLTLAGTMKSISQDLRSKIQQAINCLDAGDKQGFANAAVHVLMNHNDAEKITNFKAVRQLLLKSLRQIDSENQLKFIANSQRLFETYLDLENPPSCPTLICAGEHDHFTSVENGLEIAAAMPLGRMAVIHHADHLFNMELQQAAVAQLLAQPHSCLKEGVMDNVSFVALTKGIEMSGY